MTSTTRRLKLKKLVRDPRFQMRKKLDQQTIIRYANVYDTGGVMPPIQVMVLNKAPHVIDGFHRVAALERLGRNAVDVITLRGTPQDALWYAAKANLEHGLPLKREELRKAFRAYVKARRHRAEGGGFKSYREIAQELGGSRRHTTMHNWMRKEFPSIARAMSAAYGGDGMGNHEAEGPPGIVGTEYMESALQLLNDLTSVAVMIRNPDHRGALIERMEEAVCAVKDGGAWTPPRDPF